jgi:nucleoside-diphosphate-sugar epimerase
MKIVVISGTGLIGSKTVVILRHGGHEVVAAARGGGVNTVSGEELKEALAGARTEALSGFPRAYFSLSRLTTSLPSSPRWPSLIRELIEASIPWF